MHKMKSMKSKEMFPIINELITKGINVRITVTGMSMYPFLREGKDSVLLAKTSFGTIKKGDIIIILRDNGQYVMHRVIRKEENCFYIIGDAQEQIEGPIKAEQLVAVVIAVWRNQRFIKCTSFWWKLLSSIWLNIVPLRYFIIKSHNRIRMLIRYND